MAEVKEDRLMSSSQFVDEGFEFQQSGGLCVDVGEEAKGRTVVVTGEVETTTLKAINTATATPQVKSADDRQREWGMGERRRRRKVSLRVTRTRSRNQM